MKLGVKCDEACTRNIVARCNVLAKAWHKACLRKALVRMTPSKFIRSNYNLASSYNVIYIYKFERVAYIPKCKVYPLQEMERDSWMMSEERELKLTKSLIDF